MLVALLMTPSIGHLQDDAEHYFEAFVRPILVARCLSCHGAEKQSGELRLDSRQALLDGGSRSAAIRPGDPSASLMIKAVRRSDDLAMPPEDPLSAGEIRILEDWVASGAAWPDSVTPAIGSIEEGKDHWAFQSVQHAAPPLSGDYDWVRTPVDAFVLAKLKENGLSPAPAADRRTLIRRVTYSLTGLPPRPAAVTRFLSDPADDAYERLVERLLASKAYGEQWARHWLDVARYSDTKGYVYAREERFWVHAWAYRDWVVDAFNDDVPYDRFLLLQLAADQVDERHDGDLAAMGFLTIGRRFLGVRRDIIDDRIDVVSRGMMGLTVTCARCHDHKYDPIPMADYYSLYGVFDSSLEDLVRLDEGSGDDAFEAELQKRKQALQEKMDEHRAKSAARVRRRVADYLYAQSELHKYPAAGFDQIFQADDLLPAFVRRWQRYLQGCDRNKDAVFKAWRAYAALPDESFAKHAPGVTQALAELPPEKLNPQVAELFQRSPQSFREVCDRYGTLFAAVEKEWHTACARAEEAGRNPPTRLDDADSEALRAVLFGTDAPCTVPRGSIVHCESYFDTDTCTELWKLQGKIDRWIIDAKTLAPHALTLVDKDQPVEPRIFRRGNPLDPGREVPRQFLAVLADEDRRPFQRGSGRLELAREIIDPRNPLTARVWVNRVWAQHFGKGIVDTPSDFGVRAPSPSHPGLLDWLATEFMAAGWSTKQLHRWIVLSSTFRQSSFGPPDASRRADALRVDPGNRLLWRMATRRLTFEETRDSLLAATGQLQLRLGGKPSDLFSSPYPRRRTLYGLVDRQYLPGTLRMFDFASPDLHVAKRSETTVPQQSLFFMNHPIVLEAARSLAEGVEGLAPAERIRRMFASGLQRAPTAAETDSALALVQAAERNPYETAERRPTLDDWQYGYGRLDEEAARVVDFNLLPHFTGDAWQGGGDWPDARLGWVQLTATGGHPGNDRSHAAIRRWIAPRKMRIRVQSRLVHEPTQGDGIRAFIVSSRQGILDSALIHHDETELDVAAIAVLAGETVDLLVDIGDVLNSDQYLWHATILAADDEGQLAWDSQLDFPKHSISPLSAWEQLAQVILCTNEFLFID